jgi:hypothetical protein
VSRQVKGIFAATQAASVTTLSRRYSGRLPGAWRLLASAIERSPSDKEEFMSITPRRLNAAGVLAAVTSGAGLALAAPAFAAPAPQDRHNFRKVVASGTR